MSGRSVHTVVLGLGGIGSGALYWLSRELGEGVLGIEQFELGHDRGGSQDHSRIIRYSYHRPVYVRLAERAYEAWGGVETETGETLVHRVGGLDLFPEGGVIPPEDYTKSLDACGIPWQRLEASEIRDRWPGFRIPDSVWGLYQADGGLVDAARGNAAHVTAARRRGARVLAETPVRSVRIENGRVEIEAGGGTWSAERLVVAAGAWSNGILGQLGIRLPLVVTREQVTYFRPDDLAPFAPERFPVWIWMDEPSFYGFPVHGLEAVKVAQDVGGGETTADDRSFDPDPDATERVRGFLRERLPGALGAEVLTKTCLYTLTPDRDFVVDRLPDHPQVAVAIGAGHAFKFASALGRILSELALEGTTEADLSHFRIDRPILRELDPPRSWMV